MRDSPGSLPGSGGQEQTRGDAPRELPKHDQLPELIGPAQPGDSARTRQNRLNDMQGRILQDLNSRTRKTDAGTLAKPGDLATGRTTHTDAERNKTPDLERDKPLAWPGEGKSVDVDRSRHADVRFADRYKSGQLHDVTRGEVARSVKLEDQFRLRAQGDVARRLELEKHVGHRPAGAHLDLEMSKRYTALGLQVYGYHGPIGPHYTAHCFKHHYYGPAFFPTWCWYPAWDPWVDWSWHHHCPAYWDPRPIYCRPVVYVSCPVWAYYPVPVWTPLPAASCGTWVDVPARSTTSPCDLQLLAVRFLDPGHPQENLGPRYRVWFRNNSNQPVAQPFNVVLLASTDANLAANLPQAGVRVTSIGAGDTQSVDIRLPLAATTMACDAQGNPAPFNFLHVLVDAQRETNDALRETNGARLAQTEILPVDPSTFDVQPLVVAPGGEALLAGEGFGPGPGRVVIVAGGQEVDAEILGWYDLGVRVSLPKNLAIGPAELVVVRADGAAANPARITLAPGQ